MKVLLSLAVTLLATSCVVPPSCLSRHRGASTRRNGHFATVTVFSKPVEEPLKRRYPTGVGMWERFERGEVIRIDAKGGMTVSASNFWPERCLAISQEDLAEISGQWKPFLERVVRSQTTVQVMANPYAGDDWRAYGPLLSISFGSTSGKHVGILWDGQLSLPKELDDAVMGTLEVVCSNSRLAKRYLLRDLPQQIASRLECSRAPKPGHGGFDDQSPPGGAAAGLWGSGQLLNCRGRRCSRTE